MIRHSPKTDPRKGERVSRAFRVFAPPDWSWAQGYGTFGKTIARFTRSPRLAQGLEVIDEKSFEPEVEGGVLLKIWRFGCRLASTRL